MKQVIVCEHVSFTACENAHKERVFNRFERHILSVTFGPFHVCIISIEPVSYMEVLGIGGVEVNSVKLRSRQLTVFQRKQNFFLRKKSSVIVLLW